MWPRPTGPVQRPWRRRWSARRRSPEPSAARRAVDGEELLWNAHAAQGVAAERDQIAAPRSRGLGESRRDDDALLQRAAHAADPAGLVDGRPQHREVEPLAAAEIAEQQIADMERQIEIRG